MQNNDCIHNFKGWKPLKKAVADCESMEEESRAVLGTTEVRKCKNCGLVETRFIPFNKKGKTKHMGLNMNNNR
jgi:hypothetical protein